ncbi:MAG: gliding motility protein GldN [Flavobacteriales bacterium]|nr:gliding motility protein GldN [Flavobacteriales bacterium]
MKTLKKALVVLFFASISIQISAQNKILDGIYIKEHTPTRRVIPYTHVREADVMWSTRVWRLLDLREKINHPLYYPLDPINNRKSLFQVIKEGVEEGTITAYDNPLQDDEFKLPMTKAEAKAKMGGWEKIFREDTLTGDMVEDSAFVEVTSGAVRRYWVKEDWIFDRERSIMDVRILGIAPMKEVLDADGVSVRGYAPLFWIYFPEARYVFANYDVFNRQNDAERRTFDDIFWKRMFTSYIRKRSNVYERYFVEYLSPIDQLLESDKVKDELFKLEHDMWNF